MDSDYLTLLRAEPVTISELVWSSQTSLYLAGGTPVHIAAAVRFRVGCAWGLLGLGLLGWYGCSGALVRAAAGAGLYVRSAPLFPPQ